MNYLSISTTIIICMFEIYLLFDLFGFVFKTKITDKKKQVGTAVLLEISMLCINRLDRALFNVLCMILLTAIWGCFVFEASFGMSLVYSSLYCIVASVGEVIGGFIYSLMELEKHYNNDTFSMNLFFIILLEKSILFVALKIWQAINKKYGSTPGKGMLLGFFILPVSTFFVIIGITQFDFVGEMFIQQKFLLMIGCTLLLFSNIFVYHLLERFSNIMEKSKVMEIINTKAMMEQKHYVNIEKIEQERKEYMHDIHKHLSVIARLVEDRQNDKVLELLEQLDIRMYDVEKRQYCYDRILNAILLEKANEAATEEIELTISIEAIISMDGIDDLDKIAMIGNLLDNAIEAAKKCTNRKMIRMNMFKGNNHYLVIIIRNTYGEKLVKVKGDYITSKEDKRNHGIGIKKVRGIAEKYGGILETKVEENLFGVELYLPMKIK